MWLQECMHQKTNGMGDASLICSPSYYASMNYSFTLINHPAETQFASLQMPTNSDNTVVYLLADMALFVGMRSN